MVSDAVQRFLARVEETSTWRLEVAQQLDPEMLEKWATACERLAEPDPRWAEFEQQSFSQGVERLQQLVRGTWPERWAAVCNPHTPEALLQTLSQDLVPFIAGLASRRLNPKPRPLPERIALRVQPYFNNVVGYDNMEKWDTGLLAVHQRWSSGQISTEEALRYVELLPEGWQITAKEKLSENPDLPEELWNNDISLQDLLRYAPLIGKHIPGDVEAGDAFELFLGAFYALGIDIDIPVHARFSDDELFEWLQRGAHLEPEQRDNWAYVVHFPLPDGYGEEFGQSFSVYPGGSIVEGMVSGSCMEWMIDGNFELEGFPARATGFELLRGLIEQVLPGHFILEWC